jgi:hypothetical protein
LICANDWIRGSNIINVEENTEEMAKLEEGTNYETSSEYI